MIGIQANISTAASAETSSAMSALFLGDSATAHGGTRLAFTAAQRPMWIVSLAGTMHPRSPQPSVLQMSRQPPSGFADKLIATTPAMTSHGLDTATCATSARIDFLSTSSSAAQPIRTSAGAAGTTGSEITDHEQHQDQRLGDKRGKRSAKIVDTVEIVSLGCSEPLTKSWLPSGLTRRCDRVCCMLVVSRRHGSFRTLV